MTLAEPAALLLLLLLPLAYVALRRARPPALAFPGAAGLEQLPRTAAVRLHGLLPWLRLAAITLAILAMARPQWGVEVTRTRREGIAIAMVIDVSSSMSAIDLGEGDQRVARLDVVRDAFRSFVAGGEAGSGGRSGDAIGMIAFARFADILLPPTLDHTALLRGLDQVQLVDFPLEDGTAIGDAILRGVAMLRPVPSPSKVMILLTDGSNNVGKAEPIAAARIAAGLGIKIYTIGAGTDGMAAYPMKAPDGTIEYRMSKVTIDESTLDLIARITEGAYFRATDASALQAIYAAIDELEKSPDLIELEQLRVEIFPFLAGLCLALLLLEAWLTNTRLQVVP